MGTFGLCDDCKFWAKFSPAYGICAAMQEGAMQDQALIVDPDDEAGKDPGLALVTKGSFGCNCFAPGELPVQDGTDQPSTEQMAEVSV